MNDINTLHKKAIEIAKKFHQAEMALIDVLQEIDSGKIFVALGFASLFDYAVKALKLSEANASNFITVARKSKTIPELKQAIANGSITVSKARKITPVLTKENSSHWIGLAQNLSKNNLEKEVAKINPQVITPEKTRYVTEDRLELKLGLSEHVMKKLRRAQDLVSQKWKKPASLEQTLENLLEVYLYKNDPIEKAKRSQNQNNQNDAFASVPGHVSRYIPSQIKHQINLRDQAQCTFQDQNGQRCENQRWLEFHHIIPLAQKGSNSKENLTTLCYNHHKKNHLS